MRARSSEYPFSHFLFLKIQLKGLLPSDSLPLSPERLEQFYLWTSLYRIRLHTPHTALLLFL